jgi:hypothetical protein
MKLNLILLLSPLFFSLSLSAQHFYTEPDSTQLNQFRSGMLVQELDLWVNEIAAVNNSIISDEYGEYDDWIEIYNFGDDAINLNGLYITDNINNPTKHLLVEENPGDLLVPAGGFLLLWADDQTEQGSTHLNFSLSGSGEYVGLYSPDVILIDGTEFGQQISDVTYGRNLVGGQWNYFPTPTPNAPNGNGLFDLVATPTFSNNSAFFQGSATISISVSTPGATIYYTTNGAEPTTGDALYTEPVSITETTMLRARAFKPEYLSSRVATNTFIEFDNYNLDIISLSTNHSNWFGPTGIYDNRYTGLEKPLHVEYFNNQGTLQFEASGGVKIHAPDSRPQQSLRLYFRSEYGDNAINHQIFEDKNVDFFKRLVLRNAGNDGQQLQRTHFRDAMCHSLFADMDDDNIYAASKPVNVFLNGVYWGIYNLRERQDRFFTQGNYGFENVDFLERTAETSNSRNAIEGDWEDYDALKAYIINNDMANPTHYEVVKNWMDIRNYVDYMVTEIWAANRDWLSNNVKFYRPKNVPSAKWKWVLWDTEYGMGCFPANDHGNPNFDALHMSMSWGGWPPHWGINSTYLMQNLTANMEFTNYFITRHADLLNSTLRTDRTLNRVQEFKSWYEGDMPKQTARWTGNMSIWNSGITTLNNWMSGNNWAMSRNAHCRQHVINKFAHVLDEHIITLNVLPDGAGFIKVNTIQTDENPWSGYYFEGVPVQLTAIAYPGYEFVEWIENASTNINLEVWMESDITLSALFEETEYEPELIVINEINYNSPPWADADDWVELTNAGNNPVLLENWVFKDSNDNNFFTIGPGVVLNPDEFLILARNQMQFLTINPAVSDVIGSFNFGLSNDGELIRLYDPFGNLRDEVLYNDVFPWPSEADGLGATLELINPILDNSLPENWFARDTPGGSPGAPNYYITSSANKFAENNLLIYPNPFNQSFIINQANYTGTSQLNLFDATGRIVLQKTLVSNVEVLDVSNLAAGMYVLQLQGNAESPQIARIVKR